MTDSAKPASGLHCIIVTPERALLDAAAEFVALPMFDGELGVLPGRAAMIGRLGAGELRIRQGGATNRYFIDGGFVQVRDNTVSVLTSRALKAEEINATAAQHALEEALKPALTPDAQAAQVKAQDRARKQLRMVHAGATSH